MIVWLPLETLPGWPEAPALSPVFYLMLMLILPALTGLVIALLAWAPELVRRARAKENPSPGELIDVD